MTEPSIIVNILPRNKVRERIDIVLKLAEFALMIYMAWEMAKQVNPELAEQERQFKEQAKKYAQRYFPRRVVVSQDQAEAFVAEVTKYVRDNRKE